MNIQWLRRLMLLGALLALPAWSQQQQTTCPTSALRAYPPTVNVRIDNDLFGGAQQDQGYTNGAVLTLVSPNLVDYTQDRCLPAIARWVNRHLERLHPGQFEQQNMIFRLNHSLYTPTDPSRHDLITEDRPYVGVLLATLGYNARNSEHLRSTQIGLGVAGPWALGRQVQNAVHRALDEETFKGWPQQLRNEPVFMLLHARMQHWLFRHSANGFGADAITHWSGALGNLTTHANLGAELRFGYLLPDDFGSSPLSPVGENTAPPRYGRLQGRANNTSAHLFIMTNARFVAHDLTLDGSTFRSSHRVHKRQWVGDIGYGLAMIRGRWKFALARYHRSREFDGQTQTPVFGSFTISRTL